MKTLFLAVALALPLAAQITAIPAASGAGTGTVTSIATSCGVGGGTITTSGTVKGTELINAQSGTSYAILTGDCGKAIVGTNAAAQAYAIAQAGSAGFAAGFYFDLRSAGAGTITLTPTTSTINGATTLALTTGQSARIISDGTNYVALLGGGSSGGTGNKAVIDTPTTGTSMTFAGGSSSAGTVDLVVPTAALSANVTSSTCSGFTVGQHVTFIFTQDATGGRTVATCAGWDAFVISPIASVATTLAFSIDASGNGHLEGASSNETPSIIRMPSERAAPATPASGMTLFPDSTGHMPRWLYTGGTFFQAAKELSGIRKGNGADAVDSAAASADVVGLFTGCSGTLYLGADGACHSASGGSATQTFFGNCTGSAQSAGNGAGLNGLGGNTASGSCAQGAIQASGTLVALASCNLQRLFVASDVNGAGVSDGVVTVNDNAGATTLTCTIGTGTSCSDTTHTAATTAGHQIWISIATTSTNLHNLAATIICQ